MQLLHSHIDVQACLKKGARDCVLAKYIILCWKTILGFENKQPKESNKKHEIPDRHGLKVRTDITYTQQQRLRDCCWLFFQFPWNWKVTEFNILRGCWKTKQHFSRHGILDMLISDQGQVLKSEKFKRYEKKWDFQFDKFSSARHSTVKTQWKQQKGS